MINFYLDRDPPLHDLQEIVRNSRANLNLLRNANILMSGGTGFIGKWIIYALDRANIELGLNLRATVISRNVLNARKILANAGSSELVFLEADLSTLDYRDLISNVNFTHILHGGVAIDLPINKKEELYIHESSLKGAKALLDLAKHQGNVPTFVHLSSGAVYGRISPELGSSLEVELNLHKDGISPYGMSKIETELMISNFGAKGFIKHSNPRLFTFLGPGSPLTKQFAVGNFLFDALAKGKIQVKGNPNTIRSYMYPVDLVIWLFAILANPSSENINVGNPKTITIGELSSIVSILTGNKEVHFLNPHQETTFYAPSVANMRRIYNVDISVDTPEGIKRWLDWLLTSPQV
jgi:dTDP-glucose 4,6-dehydratase